MLRSPRIIAAASVALLAVSLAGCGSKSDQAGSAPKSVNTGVCTGDDVTVTGAVASAPTITIPDACTPPTTLVTKDLAPGDGKAIASGDSAAVNYSLVTWSDKKALDSSWSRNEPFTVDNIGHAQVIDGWNQGLIGMKAGGRRLLIVPPALGYGAGGNGVKPDETLVFVIDVVSVS